MSISLSELSTEISHDGKYVQVDIYKDIDGDFYVQIFDEFTNYTCPDKKFSTDQEALTFVKSIVDNEGIDEFITIPDGISKEEIVGRRLQAAIFHNRLDYVKLLVHEGIGVNWQDESGTTPLHNATHDGKVEFVRLLLDQGANANVFDELQRTPLHYACEQENEEMVTLMLEYDADINIQNTELIGETPLSNIADSCNYNFFLFMVGKGADLDLTGWMQNSSRDRFKRRTDDEGLYINEYLSE